MCVLRQVKYDFKKCKHLQQEEQQRGMKTGVEKEREKDEKGREQYLVSLNTSEE